MSRQTLWQLQGHSKVAADSVGATEERNARRDTEAPALWLPLGC